MRHWNACSAKKSAFSRFLPGTRMLTSEEEPQVWDPRSVCPQFVGRWSPLHYSRQLCIREWIRNGGRLCHVGHVSVVFHQLGHVFASSFKHRVASVITEHPRFFCKRLLSLSRRRLMWFCSLCTKVGCGDNPYHRRKIGRLNPRLQMLCFKNLCH